MTTELRASDLKGVDMGPEHRGVLAATRRTVTLLMAAALAAVIAAPGAGAHDEGTTSHLWMDHIKPMKDVGTINTSTNPLDWTELKNVPSEFADGTDNGVESAGFGLKKVATLFAIDWTKIQRRVKNGCPVGQAIQSIDETGAATCSVGPRILEVKIADTGVMCNDDCTEGFLNLTPGTWSITAVIDVDQSIAGPDEIRVDCHLDAGGLTNATRYAADTRGGTNLTMQLIATVPGSQNLHASVNCRDHDVGEVDGERLSIVAIRLD